MIATIGGILMLVLLATDLITKAWAYAVKVSQPAYFLGFIRLRYLPGGNTGIAWGWFGNTPTAMVIVTILTVVMIGAIAALFFTVFKKNTPARIALAVIEAGAVGNLVDRLCLGYVRDFVDVSPIGFNICNFADFYITFGAVALLIIILFIGKDAVVPLGKWRKEAKEEEAREKAEELAGKEEEASEPPAPEVSVSEEPAPEEPAPEEPAPEGAAEEPPEGERG